MWSSQTDPADGPTFYRGMSNTALTSTLQMLWGKNLKADDIYFWLNLESLHLSAVKDRKQTDAHRSAIPTQTDGVFRMETDQPSYAQHMTHGPSQHSQTQGSSWAVSTQRWPTQQPKKGWSHSVDPLSRRYEHTLFLHLLHSLCVQSAPSFCAFSGQSALCSDSVSPVKGRVVHRCGLGHTEGPNTLQQITPPAVQHVQVPTQTNTRAFTNDAQC